MNGHCVMDLNLKLGDNTINLINIMKNILNCSPECLDCQINNEIISNLISKTGMIKIGTLYFENKSFDFIKHFCTLFQADSFNHQLGYFHKLEIKEKYAEMSLEFIGVNDIIEQMSSFEHLYKSDVNLEIKCIFSCNDITHEKAFLLKQVFERHRAGVIESIQILSKNNQINYIHRTNYKGILGVDLCPKVMILPDHLGEIIIETDRNELEEIVLINNQVTIACHESKFFILVKQTSHDSCFKQLTKFKNNMEANSIFKKDFNFDSCKKKSMDKFTFGIKTNQMHFMQERLSKFG